MEIQPHISIKNLSVWYSPHQALTDITCDIPRGKITAIIGPSGCGKTTLLKSLNRLIDLHDGIRVQGQIHVDGEDIYDRTVDVTRLRKRVGFLSQKPQVLPMSIHDNVAYGPRIHGLIHGARHRKIALRGFVQHYLSEASLWDEVKDRLHSPASKLSIGQQQRLCLARALAVEPEAILGDEPTSALDPISAEKIERRFLELKNRYTLVLVTHNLRQARRLADHVIFLYLGNIIEQGPAEEVFKRPRHVKTQAYLNGAFIEEHPMERVLNLKGTICPDNFVKAKHELLGIDPGRVLRIIVDYELAVSEVPRAMEYEGHEVLEVRKLNQTDWEIVVRKRNGRGSQQGGVQNGR